jgi:hypothetical protein
VSAVDLFEEYAAAFARGERPDVHAYLDRAGAERDELGTLIDGFLRATVPPPPSEEAVAALRARLSADPPLLALRKQRAVRVDEVVDALMQNQGWAAAQRGKVKRYYQQLEGGVLDARRVALPVLETIAALLKTSVQEFEWYQAPPAAAPAVVFQRADMQAEVTHTLPSEPPEQDEIDVAFRAGR